jgi:AbrB family looped-hinge helix DNA binding protein
VTPAISPVPFPFYNGNVKSFLRIDRAGRVVLPKAVRDELRLHAGDTVEFVVRADEITLRPRRSSTPLQKERGVWVFRTGTKLTTNDANQVLKDLRAERGGFGERG